MESDPLPEPPRLGILHLMVLTACVALQVGTRQWTRLAFDSPFPVELDFRTVVWGITVGSTAHGAAIAGLLLFAARRLRGMPFPVHPGEFLIVVLGIGAVCNLPRSAFASWLWQFMDSPEFYDLMKVYEAIGIGMFVICATWWIWAFVRLKPRQWRLFLLSIPLCYALLVVLFSFGVRQTSLPFLYFLQVPFLSSVVLGIVVLRDHIEGLRYPWTHWLGVTVYFWFGTYTLVNCATQWLS